ncbi:MAG: hypothetical protein ABFR82_15990, partial [Nitrospirota bacterium]
MKEKILHVISAVLITVLVVFYSAAAEQNGDRQDVPARTVKSDLNVHYTGRYCEECHMRTPEKGDAFLKFAGDFNQLCWCHNYTSMNYIHPIGGGPSEEKKIKVPGEFPLQNGKLTCSSCHNIYLQCQESQETSGNEKFLRGAPYSTREEICFRCHDADQYKKLNPHEQLDSEGQIIKEKCLYCHIEKPDEKVAYFEDVNLIGDMKLLCQNCHNIRERHPAGRDHFLEPTPGILKAMNRMEVRFRMIFPLDKDGKVTCITCHNPHEKGVIPAERIGAKGAGEQYRHRLPQGMCKACHGMLTLTDVARVDDPEMKKAIDEGDVRAIQ